MRFHRRAHALERGVRAGRRHLLQHDHEFLAAEAKQLIGRPQRARHDLADQQQHLVAEQMAVTVVDRFEVIDVEQSEPDRVRGRAVAGGFSQGVAQLREARLEGLAIQQPRQRVALAIVEQQELILQDAQHAAHEARVAWLQWLDRRDFQYADHLALALNGKHASANAVGSSHLHEVALRDARLPGRLAGEFRQFSEIFERVRRSFAVMSERRAARDALDLAMLQHAVERNGLRTQKLEQQARDGTIQLVPIAMRSRVGDVIDEQRSVHPVFHGRPCWTSCHRMHRRRCLYSGTTRLAWQPTAVAGAGPAA